MVFCGFRKPNILTVFGFFGFFKNAILEVVEVVFWGPNKFSFFACVSGLGSSRRGPRGSGTRNASKPGVSEQLCVAGPGYIALDPLYRLLVAVHFWRKFFGVSQICFFGSSNFWPNWFWKAKKRPGAAEPRRFWKWRFYPFCPGADQFVTFLARFRIYTSVAVWVRFGPLPEICLRLRYGCFFRSFPVFFCLFLSTAFL